MCSCIVALEQLLSFKYQHVFKYPVSFFGKGNSDKQLSVLIYPCVSVSDRFICYVHDNEVYCLCPGRQ
jgi:hypothetical protein